MNKKLALFLACCAVGGFVSCNETTEWHYDNGCTEGAKNCDNNSVMICKDGEWIVDTVCVDPAPYCDPTTFTCTAAKVVCADDQKKCEANSVMICRANEWVLQEACGTDKVCNTETFTCDAVQPSTCVDDQKKCENNAVMVCANNSWSVLEDCGTDKVCNTETFTCDTSAPAVCILEDGTTTLEAGATVCSADGQAVLACGAEGQLTTTQCDAQTEICKVGEDGIALCAEKTAVTCTVGEMVMNAGDSICDAESNALITCGDDGNTTSVSCGDQICRADATACGDYNACGDVPHNGTVCSTEDAMKVMVCHDGTLELSVACEGEEKCIVTEGAAACAVPAAGSCEINGTTVADGSSICKDAATLATCTDGVSADTVCPANADDANSIGACVENACTVKCKDNFEMVGGTCQPVSTDTYTTITAIKADYDTIVGECNSSTAKSVKEAKVDVKAYVNALRTNADGKVIGLFIQGLDTDNAAIYVYIDRKSTLDLSELAVGDHVSVQSDGIGQDGCQMILTNSGEDASKLVVTKIDGHTDPAPAAATIAEIKTDGAKSDYNAKLVRVNGVTADLNELMLKKDSDEIGLSKYVYYAVKDSPNWYTSNDVIGIVNYFKGDNIAPRFDADIIKVQPACGADNNGATFCLNGEFATCTDNTWTPMASCAAASNLTTNGKATAYGCKGDDCIITACAADATLSPDGLSCLAGNICTHDGKVYEDGTNLCLDSHTRAMCSASEVKPLDNDAVCATGTICVTADAATECKTANIETFDKMPSGGYGDKSFVGVKDIEWTCVNGMKATDPKNQIDGAGLTTKEGGSVSGSAADGVGTIYVDVKKANKKGGDRSASLIIDGEVCDTVVIPQTSDYDPDVYQLSCVVNKEGAVSISVKSTSSGSDAITIDNIAWNDFGAVEPTVPEEGTACTPGTDADVCYVDNGEASFMSCNALGYWSKDTCKNKIGSLSVEANVKAYICGDAKTCSVECVEGVTMVDNACPARTCTVGTETYNDKTSFCNADNVPVQCRNGEVKALGLDPDTYTPCADPTPYCGTYNYTTKCYECTEDAHCTGEGAKCIDGACVVAECTDGEMRCSNVGEKKEGYEICEKGKWTEPVSCNSVKPKCLYTAASGSDLAKAECVTCLAGGTRCKNVGGVNTLLACVDNAWADAGESCLLDGMTSRQCAAKASNEWLSSACADLDDVANFECSDGYKKVAGEGCVKDDAPVTPVCTADQILCDGTDKYKTCVVNTDPAKNDWSTTTTAAAKGLKCEGNAIVCVTTGDQCIDGAYKNCNAGKLTDATLPDGKTCKGDALVDIIIGETCTDEGAKRCSGAGNVEICKDGSWKPKAECEFGCYPGNGKTEVKCYDCKPGTTRCTSETNLQVCRDKDESLTKVTGTWASGENCKNIIANSVKAACVDKKDGSPVIAHCEASACDANYELSGDKLTCNALTTDACQEGEVQCVPGNKQLYKTCDVSKTPHVWSSAANLQDKGLHNDLTCGSIDGKDAIVCKRAGKLCSGDTHITCVTDAAPVEDTCAAGACYETGCKAATCTVNEVLCSDNKVSVCTTTNTWSDASMSSTLTCDKGVLACKSGTTVPPQCIAGAAVTCEGTTAKVTVCGADQTCKNGVCEDNKPDPVCTPDYEVCVGDDQYKVCNADGQWNDPAPAKAITGATGYTCSVEGNKAVFKASGCKAEYVLIEGRCDTKNCEENALRCEGDQPQKCVENAWANEGSVCGAGLCDKGTCLVCTPKSTTCETDSNGMGQLTTCSENGMSTTTSACTTAAHGKIACDGNVCGKTLGCVDGYHLEGEVCTADCTKDVCTSDGKIQICDTDTGILAAAASCKVVDHGTNTCPVGGKACVLTCNEGYKNDGSGKCVVDTDWCENGKQRCVSGDLNQYQVCSSNAWDAALKKAIDHAATYTCVDTTGTAVIKADTCNAGFESKDDGVSCSAIENWCATSGTKECTVSSENNTYRVCSASNRWENKTTTITGAATYTCADGVVSAATCDTANGYESNGTGGCEEIVGWCATPTTKECTESALNNTYRVCSASNRWENKTTTIPGAKSYSCAGGVVSVDTCDAANHFVKADNTCVCDASNGYESNGTGGCEKIDGWCATLNATRCTSTANVVEKCLSNKWTKQSATTIPGAATYKCENGVVSAATCDTANGYESNGTGGCEEIVGWCATPTTKECTESALNNTYRVCSASNRWGEPQTTTITGAATYTCADGVVSAATCDAANHFVKSGNTCVCDAANGYESDTKGGCKKIDGWCATPTTKECTASTKNNTYRVCSASNLWENKTTTIPGAATYKCADGVVSAASCNEGYNLDNGTCKKIAGYCTNDADCKSLTATPICDSTEKRCIAAECSDGQTQCKGSQPQKCNNHRWQNTEPQCGTDKNKNKPYCFAEAISGAKCTLCEPGTTSCSSKGKLLTCSEDGTTNKSISCSIPNATSKCDVVSSVAQCVVTECNKGYVKDGINACKPGPNYCDGSKASRCSGAQYQVCQNHAWTNAAPAAGLKCVNNKLECANGNGDQCIGDAYKSCNSGVIGNAQTSLEIGLKCDAGQKACITEGASCIGNTYVTCETATATVMSKACKGATPVCSKTKVCVECLAHSDCPTDKPVCNVDNKCIAGKVENCTPYTSACINGNAMYCNTDGTAYELWKECTGVCEVIENNATCLECTEDSHCDGSSHCYNNKCELNMEDWETEALSALSKGQASRVTATITNPQTGIEWNINNSYVELDSYNTENYGKSSVEGTSIAFNNNETDAITTVMNSPIKTIEFDVRGWGAGNRPHYLHVQTSNDGVSYTDATCTVADTLNNPVEQTDPNRVTINASNAVYGSNEELNGIVYKVNCSISGNDHKYLKIGNLEQPTAAVSIDNLEWTNVR